MNNGTSFDIIQDSNPVQTVAPTKEDNDMLRATEKNHSTLLQTVRRGHQRRKEKRQGGSVELHSASTGHAHAVCQSQPPAEPNLFH